MHYLSILFIAALLSSCASSINPPENYSLTPEVTAVVVRFSTQLKKSVDLTLETSCLWQNPYIDKIYLDYSSQDLRDISNARKLLVSVVEGFVAAINEDSLLHYQAAHFPFSADDLVVQIHFESFFGKYVDPFYVERATLEDGMVQFYSFNAYNPNKEIWEYHDEPYWQSALIAGIESEEEVPFFDKYSEGKTKSNMYLPPVLNEIKH